MTAATQLKDPGGAINDSGYNSNHRNYGCLWMSMDYLWMSMDVYGLSMDVYGCLWIMRSESFALDMQESHVPRHEPLLGFQGSAEIVSATGQLGAQAWVRSTYVTL